jgi:hypothetical protein
MAIEPFTLAAIGDQQFAVSNINYYTSFTAQTDWLAANAEANNIRFVTQLGDILENGDNLDQWNRVSTAMGTLDTGVNADGGVGIPWNAIYGNHEVDTTESGSDPAGAQADRYREYFGSKDLLTHRYDGQVGYGGVSSNDLNTYHFVKSSDAIDAREYLMLNLEFDTPGHKPGSTPASGDIPVFDAIAWAQGVIDANPGKPTVISTHVFEGTAHGPPSNPWTAGPGRNSQLQIFDKLVKDNSQVFMVLSGHTSQNTHQVKQNTAGLPVLQMVTDFTKVLPNGGDGFMRLVELDEDAGEIRVKTFTPGVPQNPAPRYRTNSNDEFTLQVNWAERFDGANVPDPPDPVDPPVAPELIGHWKFDEGTAATAADSSGNGYDAVQVNGDGSWTAGKAGGAYNQPRFTLDAAESDAVNLPGGSVSISLWVTAHDTAQYGGIAGLEGTGSTGDIYGFKMDNADKLNWTAIGSSPQVSPDTLTTYAEATDDGWVHLVGTYDGVTGVSTAYVNGSEIMSATQAGGIPDKTTPSLFRIGTYWNSNSYEFNGAIDDVRLYNGALSADDVTSLFNDAGGVIIDPPDPPDPPAAPELIAHWKFNEGTGNTTADSSVNSNTATQAGTAGTWISGKDGEAYELNNTRLEVEDSSDLQITGALTVSAWVNPTGVSNWGLIAGVDQTGGPTNDIYALKTDGGGDKLRWAVVGSGGGEVAVQSTDELFATLGEIGDGWVHVAGIFDPDNDKIFLYINGVLDTSATITDDTLQMKTTDFQIGHNASDGAAYSLKAALDDIQIYSDALDAMQIEFLFNNPGSVILEPTMMWRTDSPGTGDWAEANWSTNGQEPWGVPTVDMEMIVNSGVATVTAAPTTPIPVAASLDVIGLETAPDATPTVVIDSEASLTVTGAVNVGDRGTLEVNGTLTAGGANAVIVDVGGTLRLGAGAKVLASQASADDPQDVTITVAGKLTAEGGVSNLGDGDDDANTNLTLADGAVYDWVFGSGAENFVNIGGLLVLEEGALGITINLIAGPGSADGQEVALLAMFNDPDDLIIPSNIVINKPEGWTFDALEQSDDGEYLVLTNLTASAVVARVDGDADGDDDVDADDLAIFKAQFGGEVVGNGDADFNGDGFVTLADFAIMRGNWGATSGAAPTIDDLNATPEPATIIVMLAAGLPALLKRRRNSS